MKFPQTECFSPVRPATQVVAKLLSALIAPLSGVPVSAHKTFLHKRASPTAQCAPAVPPWAAPDARHDIIDKLPPAPVDTRVPGAALALPTTALTPSHRLPLSPESPATAESVRGAVAPPVPLLHGRSRNISLLREVMQHRRRNRLDVGGKLRFLLKIFQEQREAQAIGSSLAFQQGQFRGRERPLCNQLIRFPGTFHRDCATHEANRVAPV